MQSSLKVISGALSRAILIAAIVLVSSGSIGWTQSISGTLLGTVTDPSGTVVPRANVILTNENTNDQRTTTTDGTGNFSFVSLLPGSYTVKVEASGFRSFEKKNNRLSANERFSVGELQLTLGAVTESVSVTAAAGDRVQTASSESSALLSTRQIETIAQKGRVLNNYLLLLPGVSTNAGTADAPSGFLTLPHAGGLPNTMMTMSIDGMQGADMGSSQLFQTNVSPDSVEEIKVLMNNYQAEYGRNGGATVNVITKSGTKDFHGSAYYYKRHEMLNANSFFNNRQGIGKPIYRFHNRGIAVGGPITIPKVFNTSREKLFFFYNYDGMPSTSGPSTPSTTTLPTGLERAGDFRQSFTPGGALIVVRDPVTNAPFPDNVIPTARINKNGLALLNAMPLPNAVNLPRSTTLGAYNDQYLNVTANTRNQHLFRIDYRPTDKDSFYFRGLWMKIQNLRSSIATFDWARNSFATPDKTAVFGWTRIVSPTMVNEFTAGVKRPFELTTIDDNKAFRKTANFTAGQFSPGINYSDLLPQVSFTGAGLQNTPSFSNFQAGRFPQQEADFNYYVNDGFTITKGNHTFKLGIYAEHDMVTTGSGFGTTPMGNFSFNVDANNPNDSRHPFANALLGNFQSYSESTTRTRPSAVSINVDWYVQDSWKVTRRLTLEVGLRVAYYTPWHYYSGIGTNFAVERFDPKKAPVLYLPTCITTFPCSGTNRVPVDPRNGQRSPILALLAGPSFVPGTGDPANGAITAKEPNYPNGFIKNAGEMPQPRFGFAWDVFGNGKTAVRGGFGVQNQILRYEPQAAQAPINYTPTYYYGNLDTFLNSAGFLAPNTAVGYDLNGKTPTIYNISLGVQQSVAGTILDVKYVSTLARNLATNQAINTIPYGARFLPQNIDQTTGSPLNDNYLRPYPGWSTITERTRLGSSNFHALEVQANRRLARGLQFGVAYTFSKAMDYYGNGSQAGGGVPTAGPTGANFPVYQNPKTWSYGKTGFDQTHVLTINYTYDIPAATKIAPNRVVGWAFDNWQVSGITSFASGIPNNILLSLTDGADLVGGGDGVRANLIADPRIPHSERGFDKLFNPAAFARPARGDAGNIGSGIVRGPGVTNWDLTIFKNFPIKSETRVVQFRWEFYNLFNQTQFNTMNTTATFNAAGQQTNTALGQATGSRAARVMQASLRFRF